MQIEQRLCSDHCDMVRIRRKAVDVQFVFSCFEVNIAEGLQAVGFEGGEFDEQAAVSRESLKVAAALPVNVCTHFFDLEIGNVADATAEGTLVCFRAAEFEAFDESSLGEHLARCADDLGEADVVGEYADDVTATCYPYHGFVFFCFDMSLGVEFEKLGMQGPLKKAESQVFNCDIDFRQLHSLTPQTNPMIL